MRDLPTGTVTLLFTDIEGSTRLLHELGDGYGKVLAEHRRVLREAFAAHGGVEVDTQGDAFFVAFARPSDALGAAEQGQRALDAGPVRVRMGLHTGEPAPTDDGYVGGDVHLAARVMGAGHGGQVLVSEATARLVGLPLRDLGEHRLKDLRAPVRLFQLGAGEFPPLRTLNQTNLPVQPTPFLGRERELGEVLGLLRRSDTRLLTLTGAGGSGKTRLALQAVAETVEEHPDGVWWVPLQALRDPALVVPAVASTLGARDQLAEHVGDRRMLVLLDNCEQVVGAAPALAEVLGACPNLRLVATSRQPLQLAAEQQYPVPPFAEQEAVGFFGARARAAVPSFVADGATAEICRRLDCLPLALELAAARVKSLTPDQLLARLDRSLPLLTGGGRDAPARQRTLRATIEWSVELLDEDEQRLLARLSVFAGGCTVEDAEAVCDADLDTLASLVDKSLLQWADGRYGMLETVREFVGVQLDAAGERDAVSARLVGRLLGLVPEFPPFTPLPDADNWRAATDWALERGAADDALALTLAGRVWRAEWPELIRRLERALAARSDASGAARGRALSQLSIAYTVSGDRPRATHAAEHAAGLLRAHGTRSDLAEALLSLGQALAAEDFDKARTAYEEALAVASEDGDDLIVGSALHLLGELERDLGNRGRARDLLRRALDLLSARGHEPISELHGLGDVELEDGELEAAEEAYERVAEQSIRIAAWFTLANALGGLAAVAAARGHLERAGRLWGAMATVEDDHGVTLGRSERERYTRRLERLDADALAEHVAAGRALATEDAVEEALRG